MTTQRVSGAHARTHMDPNSGDYHIITELLLLMENDQPPAAVPPAVLNLPRLIIPPQAHVELPEREERRTIKTLQEFKRVWLEVRIAYVTARQNLIQAQREINRINEMYNRPQRSIAPRRFPHDRFAAELHIKGQSEKDSFYYRNIMVNCGINPSADNDNGVFDDGPTEQEFEDAFMRYQKR